MNNDGSDGLAGKLCQTMKEYSQKINTEDEKEVCEFIVKNLLKIRGSGGKECGKGTANDLIEDYVYCAIMNLWSTMYLREHCNKKNVIHTIFDEMKSMGAELKGHSTCNVCEYKELKAMKIMDGKRDVLTDIFGAIKGNTPIMQLINKKPTQEKDCKGQKNDASELVATLMKNSVTMTTGPSATTTKRNDQQQSQQSSADSGTNSAASRGSGSGTDLVYTLKSNTITVESVPSKGSIGHGDVVVLTFKGRKPPADSGIVSGSTDPCKSFNKIKQKWFKNRGRNEKNVAKDVNGPGGYWDDVKKRLDELSGAMTMNGRTDSNLCSTMNGENKQACNLILSGLKHIYGITKGTDGTPRMKEDNLIFHRTMGCVLLNAYANELIEMAKLNTPTCDVKGGIKHAFSKSADVKKDVSSCKDDDNCAVCNRESYDKCVVGDQNVKTKVDELLKHKKDEIQKTLDSICPSPPVPPINPKTQLTSTNDCKDETDCLNKKVEKVFQNRWNANNDQVYGLFQEFNRELREDDEKDGFTSVCDQIVENQGVDGNNLPKCFCKFLIRNLVKVTNNRSTYNYKDKTWNVHDLKNNTPCHLLNLWLLLYGMKYSLQEKDVLYAFKAISNLSVLNVKGQYENCVYTGKFEVQQEYGGATLGDIYKWFMNQDITTKMGAIKDESACNRRSRSDDQSSEDPKKKVEEISASLKTKAKDVAEEIKKGIPIVAAVDKEVKPPSPGKPPPSTPSVGSGESGCSGKESIGFQDGEAELWRELFTKFNNVPTEEDMGKEEWEKYESLKSVCEVHAQTEKEMGKEEKEFCEVIIKNLMIVNKNLREKGKNSNTIRGNIKPIGECDLLHIWLLYVGRECRTMEEVKYAFDAVKGVGENFWKDNVDTECTYGRMNNLHREGEDMLNRIHTWFIRGCGNETLKHTHKMNWCRVDERKYRTPGLIPKGSNKMDEKDKEKAKEFIEKLEELRKKEENKINEVKKIMQEIDKNLMKKFEESKAKAAGQLTPSPPPPPPAPAAPGPQAPAPKTGTGEASGTPNPSGPDTHTPPTSTSPGAEPSEPGAPGPGPAAAGGEKVTGKATTELNNGNISGQVPQPPQNPSSTSEAAVVPAVGPVLGGGGTNVKTPQAAPKAVPLVNKKRTDPSDLLAYLPTIPVFLGMSAMTYFLWKYFALPGKRRRYKRAHQVSGPPPLGEQPLAHVDDQADDPHGYTLVKERKPRSTPIKRRKKRSGRRRAVGRRTIIDIHLEVLDECQKGDTNITKQDFFEILVREFMGCEFIKEENVPKEYFLSKEDVPKEQDPSSDSGFREERLCS
ncbi:SICA antigen [Plasmodium coatneyi]|uniref:SICA antigen n=1 Tax=Plasmodium coatneyi TaxID=208452 RepID=A0A1B1DVX3_9APIC|nr:SICA antigen [Plasmodium coatneyi]ANQ06918.1 SICA antigen [Plasmodium coatneyi]